MRIKSLTSPCGFDAVSHRKLQVTDQTKVLNKENVAEENKSLKE